jgi:hypothetical protein
MFSGSYIYKVGRTIPGNKAKTVLIQRNSLIMFRVALEKPAWLDEARDPAAIQAAIAFFDAPFSFARNPREMFARPLRDRLRFELA